MGAIEDHHIYGIQIRESANDGSDFTNPDADYRLAFLGEDGLWHVKDSSGTVTSPFTGGSASVDTEDFILGGDVTMVNATTFYDGPSGSFAAGTWLIIAQTMVKVTVTTSQTYAWQAKLWDGTNVYAEAFEGARSAGNYTNWAFGIATMTAIVTLGGSTTLKTSVQCNRGSSASAIARTETGIFAGGLNLGSRIVGYRVF